MAKESKEAKKAAKAEKKAAKKEAKKAKKGGRKTGLDKINKVLVVLLIIAVAANVVQIVFSSAKVADTGEGEKEFVDEVKIDEFQAGTYGGIEFGSVDDVVNYYKECYDYTKTLTADYTENGEAKKLYKLIGEEKLDIQNLLVEGKENGTINSLVPGIVGGLFTGGYNGLSPSGGAAAEWDKRDDGKVDQTTSHLEVDDVLACNVVDNGDGTINITIQPKAALLAMPDQDSQGRFFNVLGDISGVVGSISVLSFSEGTIDDNFVVNYAGGTGVVTIDTKTKEITAADYEMDVHIDVKHANVAVLKDKSAALDIVYTCHFPASDEYLANLNVVRK